MDGLNRREALLGASGALIAGGQAAAATIDRVNGAGGGRRPGIILLHGADGVTQRQSYVFASNALAAQGYTVLFPHYFSGGGTAPLSEIHTRYPQWLARLKTILDEAAADPAIDPRRMALVGISLGGALALSLAAQDARIKAVVSYFGFRPRDLDGARPKAPTLILHGNADRIVPVANADSIEALLRSRGVPVEKRIYPGEGHGFGQAAQRDAATRTAAFLGRHLA